MALRDTPWRTTAPLVAAWDLTSSIVPAAPLLCPQVEVGASIYKEGAESSDMKDDVLCLRIKSMNAIINL